MGMITRTARSTGTAMATEKTPGFLPLMVWLSPSFPVGAFAYSHGIEWMVEAGDIKNAATLEAWLDDLLEHGGTWSDAVLLAAAHQAIEQGNDTALAETAELAAALSPSKERRLETLKQGEAFLLAVRASWPCKALDRLARLYKSEVAFPVAVGVAAAGHGLALNETLEAYLLSLATNLVSAAVRLVPLGQTDAVKIVARLTPLVRVIATRAAASTLDDVGGAALRSDIASMRHETQHTRLFRS
jgi:urease accessory protein